MQNTITLILVILFGSVFSSCSKLSEFNFEESSVEKATALSLTSEKNSSSIQSESYKYQNENRSFSSENNKSHLDRWIIDQFIKNKDNLINFPYNEGDEAAFKVNNGKNEWKIKLVKKLGKGTFGQVFRFRITTDSNIIKDYAVKLPNPKKIELKDVIKEVNNMAIFDGNRYFPKIYALISLKNIKVKYISNSKPVNINFDYLPTIWMEVAHNDLYREKLFTKSIYHQIIKALNIIKNKQIIHADIKPQNILIKNKDQILICDLGGSRSFTKVNTSFPSVTDAYIAPEFINFLATNNLKDKENISLKKFDIYSSAMTMFAVYFANKHEMKYASISNFLKYIKYENEFKNIYNKNQNYTDLYTKYEEYNYELKQYLKDHEENYKIGNRTYFRCPLINAIYKSLELDPKKRIDLQELDKILN